MSKIFLKIIMSTALLTAAAVAPPAHADSLNSNRLIGLGKAMSHQTAGSKSSNVLGAVSGGTPGRGFGAGVSGVANAQGVISSSNGFTASGGVGGAGGSHHK